MNDLLEATLCIDGVTVEVKCNGVGAEVDIKAAPSLNHGIEAG